MCDPEQDLTVAMENLRYVNCGGYLETKGVYQINTKDSAP